MTANTPYANPVGLVARWNGMFGVIESADFDGDEVESVDFRHTRSGRVYFDLHPDEIEIV